MGLKTESVITPISCVQALVEKLQRKDPKRSKNNLIEGLVLAVFFALLGLQRERLGYGALNSQGGHRQ